MSLLNKVLIKYFSFKVENHRVHVKNCPKCMCSRKKEDVAATPRGVVDIYICTHCDHHYSTSYYKTYITKEI